MPSKAAMWLFLGILVASFNGVVSTHSARSVGQRDSTGSSTHVERTTNSTEPCTVVAQQANATQGQDINADDALSCLRSVPLDIAGGTQQLLGLQLLAQFQSTLAYLKDLPAG